MTVPETVLRRLRRRVSQREFREFLAGFLLELCRIDTIPTANTADTARREGELFALIRNAIQRYGPAGRLEHRPIPADIAGHPFYTFPHYAGTSDAYSGRSNLLFLQGELGSAARGGPGGGRSDRAMGGAAAGGIAVNAHIDTVAPYFSPWREGQTVFGRGACDDKGSCAVIVATLRLLRELERGFDLRPACPLTFMFAIDEEMGGNGSLALAMDRELGERYATVAVLECCGSQVHPGGRGAVCYRVQVPAFPDRPPAHLRGYDPLLLALEIIRGMDREGRAIRAESSHPLFPPSAVQTSPGVLGPFGEHPSRTCAYAAFLLAGTEGGEPEGRLRAGLEAGLAEYIRLYGDKSGAGAGGGPARLERHYELYCPGAAAPGELELRVYGLSGHMGGLQENDNALIKAAYLLEPLRLAPKGGAGGWTVRLPGREDGSPLLLEGGQGFVPTHSMEQIEARLSGSVQQAYRRYARATWKRLPFFRDTSPQVSFSRLHNEAYQSDPASPAVAEALRAAQDAGVQLGGPLLGWEASSDARIFAHLRPDLTVFTTGPGRLALAHSDQERITADELAAASLMLTLFLLRGA